MDSKNNLAPTGFVDLFKTPPRTDPFENNRSAGRLYERAERLVGAIFLLTNHIPENEIHRKEVRLISLSLLPQILALRDDMRANPSKAGALEASVRHSISLIRILVLAGSVSAQNGEVVIGAFDDLAALLEASARSPIADPIRFSRTDLIETVVPYKGHIKDKTVVKDTSAVSDMVVSPTHGVANPSPARRSTIVSILKDSGELNIKDISAHLPEYGEKTIQRELTALMAQGVVKRVGLKRWSRYSLV